MPACVELRVPNRREYVAIARMAVAGVASRMSFDIEAIEDMKVAVSEACNNAIEHGCPERAGSQETIVLRCELNDEELVITVTDPGEGFNPETATRQRHGSMVLTERGLGMLLIESLMDDVSFSSHPGDGTEVRMVKRLRARVVEER